MTETELLAEIRRLYPETHAKVVDATAGGKALLVRTEIPGWHDQENRFYNHAFPLIHGAYHLELFAVTKHVEQANKLKDGDFVVLRGGPHDGEFHFPQAGTTAFVVDGGRYTPSDSPTAWQFTPA